MILRAILAKYSFIFSVMIIHPKAIVYIFESKLETMEFSTFGLLGLTLLLGIKHSLDADHVVAISSIITRSPSLKNTLKLSFSWAIGHMVTAGIITFILFTFKEEILVNYLANFEALVAIMLILIGVLTILWEFDVIKWGKHTHGHIHYKDEGIEVHPEDHLHSHEDDVEELEHVHVFVAKREHQAIFGIGIIHGLASNDELLLLFTLTLGINNFLFIFIGLLIFSFGVVLGMSFFGTAINSISIKTRREKIIRIMNISIALIAIGYAVYTISGGDTINLLPFIGE